MNTIHFMSDLVYSGVDAALDHSNWINSLPINKYDPNWLNKVPWNKASDGVQRAVQGDILKQDAINTLSKRGVYMPTGETGLQSGILKHSGIDGTGTKLGFVRSLSIPKPNAVQTEISTIDSMVSPLDDIIKRQTAHTHPDIINGINLMNTPRAPSPLDLLGSAQRKNVYETLEGTGTYNPELVYTMEGGKPTAYDYQVHNVKNPLYTPNTSAELIRNIVNDAKVINPETSELSTNPLDYEAAMKNRTGQLKWASSQQNPAAWIDYRKTGGLDDSAIPFAKPIPITETVGAGLAGGTAGGLAIKGGKLLKRRAAAKAATARIPSDVKTMAGI